MRTQRPSPKQELTFVMIKPDGVRKGLIGEIVKRFEQRDMKIVALDMFEPSRKEMDSHYPKDRTWIERLGIKTKETYERYGYDLKHDFGTENLYQIGKTVRGWLVDFMISGPLVKMVVQGIHSVDMVRKIIGPTLPYIAPVGTIRGDYSADSPVLANSEHRAIYNLAHASETPEEARHEIKLWFKGQKLHIYKRFGVDE